MEATFFKKFRTKATKGYKFKCITEEELEEQFTTTT